MIYGGHGAPHFHGFFPLIPPLASVYHHLGQAQEPAPHVEGSSRKRILLGGRCHAPSWFHGNAVKRRVSVAVAVQHLRSVV